MLKKGHLHPFDYRLWAHKEIKKKITCPYDCDIDLIKTSEASFSLDGWIVECKHGGQSNTWIQLIRLRIMQNLSIKVQCRVSEKVALDHG